MNRLKKKILFVIHDLGQGGAEKVLVNLVNNMSRERFDITVLSLFGGGVNEQYLKKDIRFIVCYKRAIRGNSKIMKLFSPRFLYHRYIKEQYDIIVSYLEGPSARIVSGCPDTNVKLVNWIHCKLDTKEEVSGSFRSFEEAKKCYERFDRTICVSKWVMNYFKKTLDYKKPMEVLYNTIETDEIIEKSTEGISDYSFDDSCIRLCSVGKIATVKGFDRLARIHKRLLENGLKHKILILGVGPEQSKIEVYLKKNQLQDSFSFLGYQTNPYKYVAKCDLYVCSSLSEGFSTAVTESLVVGTPVVTTLCSGMQEILGEHDEYGIVTENDEDALFEGIKRLLDNPELLAHYKRQAEIRGKFFSTENTVKAVEDMLLSL